MKKLQKIIQENMGATLHSHSTWRQASKKYPLVYPETCFAGRSQIRMEQLREISRNRHFKGV